MSQSQPDGDVVVVGSGAAGGMTALVLAVHGRMGPYDFKPRSRDGLGLEAGARFFDTVRDLTAMAFYTTKAGLK